MKQPPTSRMRSGVLVAVDTSIDRAVLRMPPVQEIPLCRIRKHRLHAFEYTNLSISAEAACAKTNPVYTPPALILASPNRRVYDQANRRVCVLQSPQHTRAADSAQSHLGLV
jgi:hypothetical protein